MAAPKGNLYALNHGYGRPPIFKDAKDMADKIAEYIDWEDSLKKADTYSGQGKGVYTLSGCALFLGFASVQSMYDYEQRDEVFSYVVKRFRLFMTHLNEQKLYWGGTFAGAMFWLKNWGGYTDEATVNNKQHITNVVIEEKKRDEK
jgi:hypothetical protein